MTTSESNRRIAKNTIFLYLRMFIMMAVTLYTSRVILITLGVEDFGIYNVVAGVVVLFSFLNNAMTIASQRFLSFALGRNDEQEVSRVFSMSLTSHIVICFIVLFIAETIGLWVLSQMNFPNERMNAIQWTYQLALLTCIVQIIRVPYYASIIAYERMSFFAWVSIVEAFLKLAIVFLLMYYSGDKLIYYSFLLLLVTSVINVVYTCYCNRFFKSTHYFFFWDKNMFKKYLSFSGWSLAGSLASVGSQQGLNMILNVFCGVFVNAAVGVSNQVFAAVAQFLGNFQTAFNPQLVKSYSSGNKEYFIDLVFRTSKFSYFLVLLIAYPIILNCDYILNIWLEEVPPYAVEFTQIMIFSLLFESISGPLWISVQATGKIKDYQLIISLIFFLNLPVSAVVLYLGVSPIYVFVIKALFYCLALVFRVFYLHKLIHFSMTKFVKVVLFRILFVTLCVIPLPLYLSRELATSLLSVSFMIFVCIMTTLIGIYFLGITYEEKQFVKDIGKKFILKIRKEHV